MVKGRLDKSASTATGYCWLVWEKGLVSEPRLVWIPPCRKRLERENDYERPTRPASENKLSIARKKTTPAEFRAPRTLALTSKGPTREKTLAQDDLFGA
jgi:hypothetical protein